MKIEPLPQPEICRSCGMLYGDPERQASASSMYCARCANLPHNIMAVLELHARQLAEKAQQVKDQTSDSATDPG